MSRGSPWSKAPAPPEDGIWLYVCIAWTEARSLKAFGPPRSPLELGPPMRTRLLLWPQGSSVLKKALLRYLSAGWVSEARWWPKGDGFAEEVRPAYAMLCRKL